MLDSGHGVLTKKASMPAVSSNFHTQKHARKSKLADNIPSYNLKGSPQTQPRGVKQKSIGVSNNFVTPFMDKESSYKAPTGGVAH